MGQHLPETKRLATRRIFENSYWFSEARAPNIDSLNLSEKKSINTIQSKKITQEMLVVGGTTWAHSIDESIDQYDVLVIEEAGQMSLANTAVISRCAKSIILVGDQQQLSQPTKANHKFGGGLSVLEYWMNNKKVVPNNLGIFLSKSWRMEPSIASIVSVIVPI